MPATSVMIAQKIAGSSSGSLSIVAIVDTSNITDISTLGTQDFVLYLGTSGDPADSTNRRRNGGTGIGTAVPYPSGAFASFNDSPRSIGFTNGTPPNTSGSSTSGIYNGLFGIPYGMDQTFDADTTLRTLILYDGAYEAGLKYTASLSDSSATPVTDSSLSAPSGVAGTSKVTIQYKAASAGQTLTVRVEVISNNGTGIPGTNQFPNATRSGISLG